MHELFGRFFFGYLLTAVCVSGAVYLLASPWVTN